MAQRDVLLRLRDLASSGRSVADIEAALREIRLAVAGQAAPVRAEDAFGPNHPWFPAMAGHLSQLDPAMFMGVLDEGMMDGYDADQLLPQIVCPVLLLQADPATGGALSNEEVERAMALLPQAVHVRVEGTSHGLHARWPHAVLRVVEGFLDETVRVESSRQENR